MNGDRPAYIVTAFLFGLLVSLIIIILNMAMNEATSQSMMHVIEGVVKIVGIGVAGLIFIALISN